MAPHVVAISFFHRDFGEKPEKSEKSLEKSEKSPEKGPERSAADFFFYTILYIKIICPGMPGLF